MRQSWQKTRQRNKTNYRAKRQHLLIDVLCVSGFSALTPYRPVFLALTATSLAYTHHQYKDRRRTVLALALAVGLAGTPELVHWYNKRGWPQSWGSSGVKLSAEAEGRGHSVQLQVDGLKCVSCAMRVKQGVQTYLSNQLGVCSVDFPTGQMLVTGKDLQPEELVGVVRNLGYEAHVVEQEEQTQKVGSGGSSS